jgi:hypothetical protein
MRFIVILLCLSSAAASTQGAVVEYTNKAAWQNAVGSYSTITFTELPANTWITTQYSHLGISFTDGSDQVAYMPGAFLNDDHGLNGAFDESTLTFSQPMYTIAIEFPGRAQLELYYLGQSIYTSSEFGGSGAGWFAGLISDQPFDEVFMYDPTGGFFIDDLHFGPAIPAPGVIAVLLTAGLVRPRRRL